MKATATSVSTVASIAPAAITSTTNGSGVDLANFNEGTFVIVAGTRTDGTHTPKLQDSADNSTFADCAAADLVGTALVAITSNSIQTQSYIGTKRYVRVVSTVSGASTGAVYGAHFIGRKKKQS